MNNDRDDDDLRHVFLATARDAKRCHICLKPQRHLDHVTRTVVEEFRLLLESAIREARLGRL